MMTPSTPFTPFTPFAPVVIVPPRHADEDLTVVAPRVRRVVRAVLGGGHPDLDDAVQESMIAIVRALPQFRRECPFVHLASRIAARTAIAIARRARAKSARMQEDVDLDTLSAAAEEGESQTRRREMLSTLLSRIPPEQAETIVLRIMLGWSLDEVAEATGVPMNTVRSRVRLAKQALRNAIARDPKAAEELGEVPDTSEHTDD